MMLEEKILPFSTTLMSVSIFHVEVPQEACDSILLFRSFVKRPTAGVTRWWVGRDNAALAEPTSSHANCLKTRRLPPVGCTLCWAGCEEMRHAYYKKYTHRRPKQFE